QHIAGCCNLTTLANATTEGVGSAPRKVDGLLSRDRDAASVFVGSASGPQRTYLRVGAFATGGPPRARRSVRMKSASVNGAHPKRSHGLSEAAFMSTPRAR